jgi:hypothetical protein
MTERAPQRRSSVVSYLELRRGIGIVGTALPFVLVVGNTFLRSVLLGAPRWRGWGLQSSMSSYYYTGMGNVFVGALCVIGVFLISYRGYDRKDAWAGTIAGLAALGVGLFPICEPNGPMNVIGDCHVVFAAILYLTLAYFSLFLFPRGKGVPDGRKALRNRVYRICGSTITACIVGIAVVSVPSVRKHVASVDPVFWLECGATIAFGISWLTKGQKIFRDAAPAERQ